MNIGIYQISKEEVLENKYKTLKELADALYWDLKQGVSASHRSGDSIIFDIVYSRLGFNKIRDIIDIIEKDNN